MDLSPEFNQGDFFEEDLFAHASESDGKKHKLRKLLNNAKTTAHDRFIQTDKYPLLSKIWLDTKKDGGQSSLIKAVRLVSAYWSWTPALKDIQGRSAVLHDYVSTELEKIVSLDEGAGGHIINNETVQELVCDYYNSHKGLSLTPRGLVLPDGFLGCINANLQGYGKCFQKNNKVPVAASEGTRLSAGFSSFSGDKNHSDQLHFFPKGVVVTTQGFSINPLAGQSPSTHSGPDTTPLFSTRPTPFLGGLDGPRPLSLFSEGFLSNFSETHLQWPEDFSLDDDSLGSLFLENDMTLVQTPSNVGAGFHDLGTSNITQDNPPLPFPIDFPSSSATSFEHFDEPADREDGSAPEEVARSASAILSSQKRKKEPLTQAGLHKSLRVWINNNGGAFPLLKMYLQKPGLAPSLFYARLSASMMEYFALQERTNFTIFPFNWSVFHSLEQYLVKGGKDFNEDVIKSVIAPFQKKHEEVSQIPQLKTMSKDRKFLSHKREFESLVQEGDSFKNLKLYTGKNPFTASFVFDLCVMEFAQGTPGLYLWDCNKESKRKCLAALESRFEHAEDICSLEAIKDIVAPLKSSSLETKELARNLGKNEVRIKTVVKKIGSNPEWENLAKMFSSKNELQKNKFLICFFDCAAGLLGKMEHNTKMASSFYEESLQRVEERLKQGQDITDKTIIEEVFLEINPVVDFLMASQARRSAPSLEQVAVIAKKKKSRDFSGDDATLVKLEKRIAQYPLLSSSGVCHDVLLEIVSEYKKIIPNGDLLASFYDRCVFALNADASSKNLADRLIVEEIIKKAYQFFQADREEICQERNKVKKQYHSNVAACDQEDSLV